MVSPAATGQTSDAHGDAPREADVPRRSERSASAETERVPEQSSGSRRRDADGDAAHDDTERGGIGARKGSSRVVVVPQTRRHAGTTGRASGSLSASPRANANHSQLSFHHAGDKRDWERSIFAMEQAQASGSWEAVCSFLRVPFGPLLHTLSYINGIELARFETACPPLARTRMCESVSKAMVVASVRRAWLKGGQKHSLGGSSSSSSSSSSARTMAAWPEASQASVAATTTTTTTTGADDPASSSRDARLSSSPLRGAATHQTDDEPPGAQRRDSVDDDGLSRSSSADDADHKSLEKTSRADDDIFKLRGPNKSWKRLTGWIGSPPAWCVLQDLYTATDGARSWEWAEGWSSSEVDVSGWFGVTAKSGRVVGLALFSNNLRGEIPASLGSLANLRELLLHHNQLVGEVPASLGQLTRLETLDLSANRLHGRLPAALFPRLSRLQYLNVSANRLSGELPAGLGLLTRLEALHVDHNSFTGPIPPDLGRLAHLEVLNASNCWLTGELPASLRDLVSLRVLFLGHNRLSGTLDALAPLCQSHAQVQIRLNEDDDVDDAHDYDDDNAAAAPCGARDAPSAGDDDDDLRDDHAARRRGELREVYANDNQLDVSDVHPALRATLSVLFVDRNRAHAGGVARRDHQRRRRRAASGGSCPARRCHRGDVDADANAEEKTQEEQHEETTAAASPTWSTADLRREMDRITQTLLSQSIAPRGGDHVRPHHERDDDSASRRLLQDSSQGTPPTDDCQHHIHHHHRDPPLSSSSAAAAPPSPARASFPCLSDGVDDDDDDTRGHPEEKAPHS